MNSRNVDTGRSRARNTGARPSSERNDVLRTVSCLNSAGLVDTVERFLVQTAGGGYAEARLRERAAIDRDVAEGHVSASSREAAATDERG
jgi:N-methylhydantoinase B/oxoprolinase/acetone carboxylase alpha subunit